METTHDSAWARISYAVALPGTVFALMAIGGPIGLAGIGLLIALVVTAHPRIPRFWRTVGVGAVAGAVAGAVVLGPGMRVVMRVVAIMEPFQAPSFTVGGTVFLVIIGLVGGAIAGTGISLAAPVASRRVTALAVAVLLVGLLASSSDLRSELTHLGGGLWVNVPMFGLVFYGYGLAARRLIARFERRSEQRQLVDLALEA